MADVLSISFDCAFYVFQVCFVCISFHCVLHVLRLRFLSLLTVPSNHLCVMFDASLLILSAFHNGTTIIVIIIASI